MKILNNKLAMACILSISLAVILSCENNDDEDTGLKFTSPSLMIVEPVQALIGDEVVLTGENLNDVVNVKFGSVEAEGFTKSGNSIAVTVPSGLEAGDTKITVFYKGSSSTNLGPSANIDFTVLYPPVITSTFPTQAKPGFEVEISGSYLADVTSIKFGEFPVSGFEATETKIITSVPANAGAGDVQLEVTTSGGTVTTDFTILERTPEIYSFTPPEGGKTGEKITVNGLFFFDVESVFIGSAEVTDFTVDSDTKISFNIPVGASTNPVTVNTALGSGTSASSLSVIEIPFLLFSEGMHPQMQNWSWGGNDDFMNTDAAKDGTYSYARTYNDAWSGIQLHHGSLNLALYSTLTFSVYGGPGTTGKVLNCNISWGASVPITITEGVWTDYTIPISDLGSPATLGELIFQEDGSTSPATPYTVYFDNISFNE